MDHLHQVWLGPVTGGTSGWPFAAAHAPWKGMLSRDDYHLCAVTVPEALIQMLEKVAEKTNRLRISTKVRVVGTRELYRYDKAGQYQGLTRKERERESE